MPLSIRNDFPMFTRTGSACDVCGCSQRKIDGVNERVVDLNIVIFGEGPMYVCETCWIEGGHMLGMVQPHEADALKALVKELQVDLAHITAERDAALSAVAALRHLDEVSAE